MSSHFKWYPSDDSLTVPWNARYSFPSQSNKAEKLTPRIPPKSGSSFAPGQVIRVEFPAQGYVNPANTTFSFDVTLFPSSSLNAQAVRFQNNIQSIFSRVRLLYGSTCIEDIIDYNQIVRCMTEWTSTNGFDQTSIAEGIGGTTIGPSVVPSTGTGPLVNNNYGLVNVRQNYIQGLRYSLSNAANAPFAGGFGRSAGIYDTPQGVTGTSNANVKPVTRRYQVQLMLGLLMQEKLIPTKWMASQLAIEITLERADGCIYQVGSDNFLPGTTVHDTAALKPTYGVGNFNMIPEILQFDSSYDTMFLQGLKTDGVPIKFSSWHTNLFSINSSTLSANIQERSRSVKAMFAVQRRPTASFDVDNGATFFDTSANGASSLQAFQFRLGGRYYPASPVQCSSSFGSKMSNGGAEAYVELAKALNTLGDYRLSNSCNINRWAIQPGSIQYVNGGNVAVQTGVLSEYDYSLDIQYISIDDVELTGEIAGSPRFTRVEAADAGVQYHSDFCGNVGSACFGMAVNLETSNGLEISGLNGEEQSDFQLTCQWKAPQVLGSASSQFPNLEVFSYYDAMLILRQNNLIELIV